MSQANTPSEKKKGFLTAGKLLWAFVFLLAVAVAALLINVWLELQRPPQQPPAPAEPKADKIEVLSPNGAPPPAPANGNPLVPQRPQDAADAAPEEAASEAAALAKPKAKAKPKEELPKAEKLTPQETVLEPVNKTRPGERALEPVNKPADEKTLVPKADKPAKRQSGGDMDNLF